MKLKNALQSQSLYNLFDILDSSKKETNLSKVVAYLVSKDYAAFGAFLDVLEISLKQSRKTCLRSAVTSIENSYSADELTDIGTQQIAGGRTDMEIEFWDKGKHYYIIVECKVSKAKATQEQYNLYKPLFNKKGADESYFVFLSHQSGIHLIEEDTSINVIDLDWRDLINALAMASPLTPELNSFLEYYERSYGLANQREILIQGLSFDTEVNRYKKGVYRRKKVNGSPLYFAPYYPKGHPEHGISSIAKILGIITTDNISWEKIELTCARIAKNAYCDDEDLQKEMLARWRQALEIPDDMDPHNVATYYFLDLPVKLDPSLKKDGGISKGRGKGWIAGAIPANRTVSFAEFLRRYNLAHDDG